MTVTYGFYDSVTGDRVYNALQFSSIFDGIILDGVLASEGGCFAVTVDSVYDIFVGSGRAWFNHTWTLNDANISLTVSNPHATLDRIDLVVLEVDRAAGTRANSIKILTGTAASTPVAPTPTQSDPLWQYPLAEIFVRHGASYLEQYDITNKVGTTVCPFVTSPLEYITTDELLIQWDSEFSVWFDNLVDQLTGVQVTNLQNQINAIVGDSNPPVIDLLTLEVHDHTGGEGGTLVAGSYGAGSIDHDDILNRNRRYQLNAIDCYASAGAIKDISNFGPHVKFYHNVTNKATFPLKLPTGFLDTSLNWYVIWGNNSAGTGLVYYNLRVLYSNPGDSAVSTIRNLWGTLTPTTTTPVQLKANLIFTTLGDFMYCGSNGLVTIVFERYGDQPQDSFLNEFHLYGIECSMPMDM